MKRFLFVIITIFAINSSTLKAQEVYNLVLNNATRIVNNPTCSYTQIQIAQFKRTALIYMKTKAFEETDSVPSNFLDTQAYYLSEFITLFFNDVVTSKRLSDEKRKERIMMFTDASISNPMFEDTDQADYGGCGTHQGRAHQSPSWSRHTGLGNRQARFNASHYLDKEVL